MRIFCDVLKWVECAVVARNLIHSSLIPVILLCGYLYSGSSLLRDALRTVHRTTMKRDT